MSEGKKSRILLVDDEKAIVDGLKVLMQRYFEDCEVVGEAYDGLEGYKLSLELRPDIVITDVRMLRLDGLKMIEMLKDEGLTAKFVIVSAYSDFAYAKKGMHLGVRHYLT
jgi:two-component system, response regulator YesN